MSTRLIAALATCAVLASAPALADRGHGHGRGFYRQPQTHVVVQHRAVYRNAPRVVYRAPRVVYGGPAYYPAPVAYGPAPVYVGGPYYHGRGHDDDAWKWVAGGALVGAILYGIDH